LPSIFLSETIVFPQESLSHRKTGGSAAYIVGHSFFRDREWGYVMLMFLILVTSFMRKKSFPLQWWICFFVEYYFKVFISIPFR